MTQANILVVDDEQDIRTLVCEILEDEGYAVTTAENGETARAAWRAETDIGKKNMLYAKMDPVCRTGMTPKTGPTQ